MKNSKLLVLSIIFIALFFLIFLSLNNFNVLDKAVNSFSIKIQTSSLVQIAKVISWLFEPLIIIIASLIIAVSLFKASKKDSILFSSLMIVTGLVDYTLKSLIERARPENALIAETNFSFPSGHALISLVFFGFLTYLLLEKTKSSSKRAIVIVSASFLILLISFSRIYLNVHWFSDVLASFSLGLFLLLVFIFLRKNI